MRRLLLGGSVLVFAVLVSGAFGGSRPSLCHVSGAGNNDYGSLQDAVNASSAGDSLKVKGTCVGSTVVDRSLVISGHGAEATLDGGMLGTVLRIQGGVTVKLTRLTITHGADTSTDGDGGGVRNLGTLTVKDSVVTDNRSGNGAGAGIYNAGDLTVTDSTISHNRAGYFGGGLYNVLGATAALRRTSVSDNAANIGGGIYNPGSLDLVASQVDDNRTVEGHGGILNTGGLTATRCSIRNNFSGASSPGGGIAIEGGTVTLNGCEVTGNQAGSGGGISVDLGTTLTLNDTRVADNFGTFGGGGIKNLGTVILHGSSTVTRNAMDPATGHGGGILNNGSLQGAIPGTGGNVYDNIPDDIYPYP